ncbi:hypothetical protein NLG97_g8318 [Lecanicillium saksenae]|uniref:Uncharacterized protein n=1 Tax=Lecanicillium saksenae TaxID=468837 RepID=A0ACC1QKW1_9HYPO|nr:hypothetical protein NLG97_g8318 [Lecanicillium saksenae]
MDPLTAMSLVGNILQFIAAARTTYKQVAEIRSSVTGLTKKNSEMLATAAELRGIAEDMSAGMQSFRGPMTPTEERIHHIGTRCQELAQEIEENIRGKAMKDPSNVIKIATAVIKSTWKASDTEKKLREVNDLQNSLVKLGVAQISRQQAGLEVAMTNLLDQNFALQMNRAEELMQLRRERMVVSQSLHLLLGAKSPDYSTKETASKLLGWVEQVAFIEREQNIIQSLRFDGMLHRRDEIQVAHKHTFQWVFEPRLHFKEWLETGEGIYWVSGDPGSGKSTMIKYISRHASTLEALEKWAGNKTLVTAGFFFWFSGTRLQKSQEGLLRSLLFEIFRQCPSTIRAACPARWDWKLVHTWTTEELMDAIKNISLRMPSTRFCFFVDGLDEYHGEDGVENGDDVPGHVSGIIKVMNKLSKLADVKLCISSRPWRAFEKAFGQRLNQKLYMNIENRNDIRSYIRDRLESDDTLIQANGQEFQSLVEEIAADSRGIFIWVSLVIESILRGLSNEDRVTELRHRLNKTPKTLNKLFERMLNSTEDIYQEQAAQILQVALHADTPVPVAVTTDVRIGVRCPDLIKIRTPPSMPTTTEEMAAHRVDFFHRTVRDFLALEDTQQRLNQRMKKAFDPGLFICNGILALIKGASVSGADTWANIDERLTLWQLFCALCAQVKALEHRLGKLQIKILDELERAIAQQTGKNDFLIMSDSFLGAMVRKNLYLYVDAKLPVGLNSHGTPLLNCALGLYHHLTDSPPLPDMVSLLLRHGAAPDAMGDDDGWTIWQLYMLTLLRQRRSHSQILDRETREAHMAIIQDLLEHGADPRLQFDPTVNESLGWRSSANRPLAHKDLLEMIRYIFGADDSEFLVALVNECRKGYSNGGLLAWLAWGGG